eukprot:GILI01022511.1.p1 GENE.GILI01022511.1~~GILI01022511.1.p1  ORF type:complete len:184 (+),score=11.07 GILI01022511.1:44-595(+)
MSNMIRGVGCGLSTALMALTLILAIVGTAGPQMYGSYGSIEDQTVTENWHLYKYITTVDEVSSSHGYNANNVPCKNIYVRYTVAFAFAIVSCIGAAVSLGICVYSFRKPRFPLQIMFWAIAANFVFLTVVWPLSDSVRSTNMCGKTYSSAEAGYRMDFGISLLVAAWCANGLASVVAGIFAAH